MIPDPIQTIPVRIRFAGTQSTDTFHLSPQECVRLHTDLKAYLGGSGPIGGDYASEEADQRLVISLNFSLIAYMEPGRVY